MADRGVSDWIMAIRRFRYQGLPLHTKSREAFDIRDVDDRRRKSACVRNGDFSLMFEREA